jgi:hypothetical protein
VTRRQVDQGGWDEKGADPPRALGLKLQCGVGDGGEAADARADDHPGAFALVLVLRRPAGILHSLIGGGDGVEYEVVDPPLLAGRQCLIWIEGALDIGTAAAASIHPRDLAGDLAPVTGRIEGADPVRAGFAREDVLPRDINPRPQGR